MESFLDQLSDLCAEADLSALEIIGALEIIKHEMLNAEANDEG